MAGKFVLSVASDGQFMFNLHAGNGQVILTSERYTGKAGASNGIESVKKNAVEAGHYERRTAADGRPYFILKAGNNLEIGRSQMYASADGMENGIRSVMENAPDAAVDDQTGS